VSVAKGRKLPGRQLVHILEERALSQLPAEQALHRDRLMVQALVQACPCGTRRGGQHREAVAFAVVEVSETKDVGGSHDRVLVDVVDGGKGRKDLRQSVAVRAGQQPSHVPEIELLLPPAGVAAEQQRLRAMQPRYIETPRRCSQGPVLGDGGLVGADGREHRAEVGDGSGVACARHGDEALSGSGGLRHVMEPAGSATNCRVRW
jgi:hypothetical protein